MTIQTLSSSPEYDELLTYLPQLSARAWRDLDENGGRGWPEWFTQAGTFDFNGRLTEGRDALRAHFGARANAEPRTTAHLVTNVFCERVGSGVALVRASICVFGGDGPAPLPMALPTLVGFADDRFEQQPGGEWLIARRSFRPLFYNPNDRVGRRIVNA